MTPIIPELSACTVAIATTHADNSVKREGVGR
jgi:hypothetical protein